MSTGLAANHRDEDFTGKLTTGEDFGFGVGHDGVFSAVTESARVGFAGFARVEYVLGVQPPADATKYYWADEREQKKLISRCLDRFAWHMDSLRATGRLANMLRMMTAYYGRGTDGNRSAAGLQLAGAQGEVTDLHVNTIRPVLQNTLSIIAGTRPAVKPVATNGDSATAAQTRLAMGLHEYYDRKFATKTLEIECVRGGLMTSAWWSLQGWKPSAGDEVTVDEKDQIIYEGDVEEFTRPPWAIASQQSATNEAERQWVLFKRKANRWELANRAKDPLIKQKLIDGAAASNSDNYIQGRMAKTTLSMVGGLESLMGEDIRTEDEVWVWELRHLCCPALPNGRMVRFVEPDIVLFDSYAAGEPVPDDETGEVEPQQPRGVKYPYEELHAYEFSPERIVGTLHGHTPMFDLLALMEFIDIGTTSMATTLNIMGMPHLWSKMGMAPNVQTLSGGITLMETPEKPESIDFQAIKPEVVQAIDWATSKMNASAALNDTVLGNPQKGMAASAQALQRAQAVQYHQISQDEWVRLIEKNANGRLRLLKRFARTERVAEIAGSANSWEMKQWKAEDIAGVERFQVEPINPMSATFEGRQAIAEQMGVTGDNLFDFMTTGSLKKVTEARTLQLELVERNKALLMRGIGMAPIDQEQTAMTGQPVHATPEKGAEYVSILRSDPHHLAIPAYLSVVNSPESRSDAELVAPALDCVAESQRLWATLTPDDCQAFGIPPLPSAMAAAATPQAPSAPPPANDNAEAPSTPQGQPGQADLPKPPPSPIEGENSPDSLSLQQGA